MPNKINVQIKKIKKNKIAENCMKKKCIFALSNPKRMWRNW